MKMIKLYTVKTKDNNERTFALEWGHKTLSQVKEYLKKDIYWEDFDLRTLKEIKAPKGRFKTSDLDKSHYILYDGDVIVSWDNSACYNYPEDLTWERDIGVLISEVEKLKELEFKDKMKDLMELK